jgi:hypothetical protein
MAKNDNISEAYKESLANKAGLDYRNFSKKQKRKFTKNVEKQINQLGYNPKTISDDQLNALNKKIDAIQLAEKNYPKAEDWFDFGKNVARNYSDQFKESGGSFIKNIQNLFEQGIYSGFPGIEDEMPPDRISGGGDGVVTRRRKSNTGLLDDRDFDNQGRRDEEGTGGTGGTRTAEEIRQSAEQKLNDAYLGSSDMSALQSSYSAYTDLEELPRFQFDDTYAPDSEGYRDIPGYLLDAARGTLGAFGATKPLEEYTPSSDFQLMGQEARSRRDLGLDQETKSLMTDQMDRAYNYDVTNIRNMSGGSGGVALANLGGASARYNDAAANMGALDAQIKAQNRQDFYNAARAGEAVNRQIFEDQRAIDMLDKQAGGALLSDSIDSIQHRKEYEDTYKKPGSPYYEYMKELTLGNRMNRDLMEFGEEQNMARYARTLLGNENQLQEEIAERERGRRNTIEQFKKKAEEEGYATSPQTAEEFDSYDGQPIVDINQPLSDQEMFGSLNDPSQFGISQNNRENKIKQAVENQNKVLPEFGYSRNQMNEMSSDERREKGIRRVSRHPVPYQTDKDGKIIYDKNERPVLNYKDYEWIPNPQYDPSKPNEGANTQYSIFDKKTGRLLPPTNIFSKREDIPNEIDPNLLTSASEDTIRKEYSQKKQALMEELYLKDEKEYNKRLKALEEEEKQAIKSAAKYKQSNNKAFTPKNNQSIQQFTEDYGFPMRAELTPLQKKEEERKRKRWEKQNKKIQSAK